MRERGLTSPCGRAGVNIRALANAVGVRYEMARRYVSGLAMPNDDTIRAIARWLGTTSAWLKFGEGPEAVDLGRASNSELLEKCLSLVLTAIQESGRQMPPDRVALLATTLYEEAAERAGQVSIETARSLLRVA